MTSIVSKASPIDEAAPAGFILSARCHQRRLIPLFLCAVAAVAPQQANASDTPVTTPDATAPTKRASAPASAKAVIEAFYRSYFPLRPEHRPEPPWSKSFHKLLEENAKVCAEKSQGDICGFGADGDVFLDAQEYDPQLTFESAHVTLSEPAPKKVQVTLNVMPEEKERNAYSRTVVFVMIQERGRWVVDDLIEDGESARKTVADETAAYLKNTPVP